MQVVFQGLESPSHRVTLKSLLDSHGDLFAGKINAGISFHTLRSRRLSSKYVKNLADDVPVLVEAGVSTANITAAEAEKFADEYYDFAMGLDEITHIVEFEHRSLGPEAREKIAARRLDDERIIPVWQPEESIPVLQSVLSDLNRVGIGIESLKDRRVPAVLRSARRPDTLTLGLGMSRFDDAIRSGFTMVMTSAWLAPATYGEFVFFDGTEMHRVSSAERDVVRKRFEGLIRELGFDYDLVKAEDAREVNRLAGYSLLAWASHLLDMRPDADPEDAATALIPSGNLPRSDVKVLREQRMLPIFGVDTTTSVETTAAGGSEIRDRAVLRTSNETIRVCNSCYLAGMCPAFQADASCSFNFPVEVRTHTQMKALLHSVLELQAGRVAFARFAEEVGGGYPEETVSKEMDRLFTMAEKLKRVEEKRERLTVSVEHEESGGSGGVLSAIFGRSPNPDPPAIEADTVIAEVVDD